MTVKINFSDLTLGKFPVMAFPGMACFFLIYVRSLRFSCAYACIFKVLGACFSVFGVWLWGNDLLGVE